LLNAGKQACVCEVHSINFCKRKIRRCAKYMKRTIYNMTELFPEKCNRERRFLPCYGISQAEREEEEEELPHHTNSQSEVVVFCIE
jgi:hypothetical protein